MVADGILDLPMTPAERRAALVEKVARVMCSDLGGPRECNPACPYCMQDAAAAFAVALEEAAKVAEAGKRAVYFDDEVGKIITDLVDAKAIATAIRSLIPEGGK